MEKIGTKFTHRLENMKIANEFLEFCSKKVRTKIVFALFASGELSLGKMSSLLKVSKGTISNHIIDLEKMNLIHIREEKVRGPILKKFYSLIPEFTSMTMTWERPEEMNFLSGDDEALKYFIDMLKIHSGFINIIHIILNESRLCSEQLRTDILDSQKLGQVNTSNLKEKYYQNTPHHEFFLLNHDEEAIYDKLYKEFSTKLEKQLKKSRKLSESSENPEAGYSYFAWTAVLPLRTIL